MKKVIFSLLLLGLIFGCSKILPVVGPSGVITIEAQTLPISKNVAWTDSDTSITSYTVTLDGTVIGNPTTQIQPIVFTTLGTHTVTVSATNVFGTSSPTVLTVNVVLPTAPSALKIQ